MCCDSEPNLRNHLEHDHSRLKPRIEKKRRSSSDAGSEGGSTKTSRTIYKRRRLCSGTERVSTVKLPARATKSNSSSPCRSDTSIWDDSEEDASSEISLSSLSDLDALSDPETTLPTASSNLAVSASPTEPFDIIADLDTASTPLEELNATDMPPIEQMGPIDLPSENVTMETDIESEAEPEYEVEQILDKKKFGRRLKYLVKWKGYTSEDNTWEPLNNLANCRQKLEEFELKQAAAGGISHSTSAVEQDAKTEYCPVDTAGQHGRLPS